MVKHPQIIQGGMGIDVSKYTLSNTVSRLGGQGTISGVTLERVMTRTLQNGDLNGDVRRALRHLPFKEISEKILKNYFVEGGIQKGISYKGVPFLSINPPASLIELIIAANFVYVWLAKEGHTSPISINYLEKVSMPHIYAITGAMLADVDFITMGAGIPIKIPAVITAVQNWETASYPIPVLGKDGKKFDYVMSFNPQTFLGEKPYEINKPGFIPIISSNLLATLFTTKLPQGSVYGFVVEEPTAGGHNAPPRNKVEYGEKDFVNYEKLAELGLPFWIAGGYASPERLQWSLSMGAKGIQCGSIFALCEESGMNPKIRKQLRKFGFNGQLDIKTDFKVSPTDYPFKVAQLNETLSEENVYSSRERICSQGGLIVLYEKENGSIGYRCPSEPVEKYLSKGGEVGDTIGRGCLCNGLLSTAGLGDSWEPPIVTLGDDTSFLFELMEDENSSYGAIDAMRYLNSFY
ncbi:MAG: nitronate monooxygenase [Candidatus Nomurabacteria bacterium]|nr:nitronate monooxygenase [Candidatus Nomurabacteria bacterium]